MSWVTMIWTAVATACLTLAAVHVFVRAHGKQHRANLMFALLAGSLAIFALLELSMMRASTTGEYLARHRAGHIGMFFVIVSIALFIRLYFGTGRTWLLAAIVALRGIIVVLAFFPGPTFNYSVIDGFKKIPFLGEPVAVIHGTPSPWARLGEISVLLLLVFVADAGWHALRRAAPGQRRSIWVVGTSVILCIITSVFYSYSLHSGRFEGPYILSVSFLFIVVAMARELGLDTVRAVQLSGQLQESNESLTLAAQAARLALWRWKLADDSIWVSPEFRRLYEIRDDKPIGMERFMAALHPEDRPPTTAAVDTALGNGGNFHATYRVPLPDGKNRWIEAWGRTDFGGNGEPLRMRGVSLDISDRRLAETETLRLRDELVHAGRVTLLGQLSSALAHELNQPLGAILRNAEAAAIILDRPDPDLDELREIIHDIHADDHRAGAVIGHLRSLLKHRQLEVRTVQVRELVEEVLLLVRSEAFEKHVAVTHRIEEPGPVVRGDRVHLLQVLLNLVVNGIDAIAAKGANNGNVTISAEDLGEGVKITVRDNGMGVSPEMFDRLFEPFQTSKPHGMGIGLPVSKTIIEAHGGTLDASNPAGGGAEFRILLPDRASA